MINARRLLMLVVLVSLVAWALSSVDAWALSRARSGGDTSGTGFQYVVKFICDASIFLAADDPDLAPGFYYTDVNIHNPNDKIVKFRKKIALDGFENEHHGLVTSPVDVTLGPDEALEINCDDINRLLFGTNAFVRSGLNAAGAGNFSNILEGFVVLYSKVKLDVAAIYTGCSGLIPEGLSVSAQLIAGCTRGIQTIQVDELIPADGVPPPTVFIRGLSVNSAGVSLSIEPFSEVGYDGAQLLIYDASGRQLHDTGFIGGTQLSWRPETTQGRPLANGVYLYMVGVRDALGNVAYKAGKFALIR